MVILGISIVFVIIIICLAYQYKIKRRIKEVTIGCLTNANGGLMNVYIEGRGNKTLLVYLSCPHYVHNYEYKMISTEIIKWLGLE